MNEFKFKKASYFKCYELLHVIPSSWKQAVLNGNENCQNVIHLDHILIRDNPILTI